MCKGRCQALRGPDGVAYSLTIVLCTRVSNWLQYRGGVQILHEVRNDASAGMVTRERIGDDRDGGMFPNIMAYTAAIVGCSDAGEYLDALRLTLNMRAEVIHPNVVMFLAIIDACVTAGTNLSRGRDE